MKAPTIRSADIEADSLYASKIWCLSVTELEEFTKETRSYTKTSYEDIEEEMSDPNVVWLFHNGHNYDKPTLERLLGCKLEGTLIDTLAVSWYLYPKNNRHGLAWWGEELGIAKPEIDDWENLDLEEYINRCEEDVKIQTKLWKMMWKHLLLLYGNNEEGIKLAWDLVMHVSFKLEQAALQDKSKWKLDREGAVDLYDMFIEKFEVAKEALEKNMPQVPVYAKKSRPAKPFKKNGELSAHGEKWKVFCEEHNIDFDNLEEHKYQSGWKEPNAGSPKQLKDWLYDMDWIPETFDFKRDKETGNVKKIPQIKVRDTGELCESIKRLFDKEPSLKHLGEMSIVKHRSGVVNGFLNDVDNNGYVRARVQGFTNTLRFKHKVCLNLPSARKPYGSEIRGLLQARNKDLYELCGSDMCSLEDRTKQHYMWPFDPEYVKDMMADDFDPHLDMAIAATMMSVQESETYKNFNKDTATPEQYAEHVRLGLIRHPAKSTNYAATYGAGPATIARAAGVAEHVGTRLHEAYWKRNWAIKAISESQTIKTSRGLKWLWNPVANIWIWLKNEKDIFSSLNQSTGTYCFDMWIKEVLSRRKQLTAQFHDEGIWELKKGNREGMEKLLKDSIKTVNEKLKLNRELDVDVQFGETYADIH